MRDASARQLKSERAAHTHTGYPSPPGYVLLGRFWLAPQSTLVPASVWSIVVSFLTATVALRLRRATCGRVEGFVAGGRPALGLRSFVARVFFFAMRHLSEERLRDLIPENTRWPDGPLECVAGR